MKKAYLLAFSDSLGTQDQVKDCLDSIKSILIWRYDMLNSFYLVSTDDAKTLAAKVKALRNNSGRFIITEVNSNYWGWLTPESWHVIQHKEPSPKQ